MMISRDKALSKKILAYHRIPMPGLRGVPRGRKVRAPKRLRFPLFVKSLTEDASLGISQASVVDDDEKLAKRVEFIHESIGTDALVEEYIEGRELYVGVLGNERLRMFPVWEMDFGTLPEAMAASRPAREVGPPSTRRSTASRPTRPATCPRGSPASARWPSASTARSSSAATRASTSA